MERDAVGVDYVPVERGAEPILVLDASPELEEVACGEPPASGGVVGVNDPRLTVTDRLDGWDTGYCRYVSILNTSEETLSDWTIELEVDGTINSLWNAERSGDSGLVAFTPLSWNREIGASMVIEFGFCGTY